LYVLIVNSNTSGCLALIIITASGIVTLCKRPYSKQVESGLHGRLQRVTIPEAVIIKFVLLRMSKVLLETC